eukprot:14632544-Heterocapsa_arctica.AAC.1
MRSPVRVATGWNLPVPTVAEKVDVPASANWEASADPYPGLIGETLEVGTAPGSPNPPFRRRACGYPPYASWTDWGRRPPLLSIGGPWGLLDSDSGQWPPFVRPPSGPSDYQ